MADNDDHETNQSSRLPAPRPPDEETSHEHLNLSPVLSIRRTRSSASQTRSSIASGGEPSQSRAMVESNSVDEGPPRRRRRLSRVIEPEIPVQPEPFPNLPSVEVVEEEPEEEEAPSEPVAGGFVAEEQPSFNAADDEGQLCPICFESWSNSGAHRLAALRCGHVFGQSCIERWIGSAGKGARCPQCNANAVKRDIRPLFVRSLKALDTTERDRALADLEKERQRRRHQELETKNLQLQVSLREQELVALRQELQQCRAALSGACLAASGKSLALPLNAGMTMSFVTQAPPSGLLGQRLALESILEMSKDGGCRVLAYSEWHTMLLASQPSTSPLFPGVGIKKVNALEFRTVQFVSIHQKTIRDMSFNPEKNDLLLTVSLDKTAKLTNVQSNAVVQTYAVDAPLWSCVWNADDLNQFFVGTQQGKVLLYDTRQGSLPLQTLEEIGQTSPVTALSYVKGNSAAAFSRGGLFLQRLNGSTFYENRDGQYSPFPLPLEGPFTYMTVEPSTRHLLVSARPNNIQPFVRHVVCEPAWLNGTCTCNVVQTIRAGTAQKLLTRSAIFAMPGSDTSRLLVAAHQESEKSMVIWEVSTGQVLQKFPSTDPVLDILPMKLNGEHYLASLTEKVLRVYKWK